MHKAFPLPVKTSHCQKKFSLQVKKVPPAEEKRCRCCEVSTATEDQEIFDSGCSRHIMGNKSFLIDYQEIDGGFVAFGGSPKGDHLGKFEGKADEGFLVGYSVNSKAFPPIVLQQRLRQDMGRWEELIRENVFKLGGNRDHLLACLAHIIYNRRTKKIMETMNDSFDELSAMAFEQRSSKPGLQ
nr:hypothetical protein [Tanacetum cinerariifolium]